MHESLRRGLRGRVPCLNARRSQYTARGYEEPHSDEGCFAGTATIQSIRMPLAKCFDECDQGQEAFVADNTQAFLSAEVREGEQLYAQPLDGQTCGVESAQRHAVSSNISETLARIPLEQVARTWSHSRCDWIFALVCMWTTCWLWVPAN